MTVHDDVGNEMSSWGPPVGAAASWPLPIVDPESFEYGPMPGAIPPSLAELAQVPRISWAADLSVSGSMDGQNPSTLVRIPVGPSTQKLTLGLKPDQAGLGFHPRIDQVFLLGRSGEVITSILGVSFLGEGFEQTLYLAIHGAPIGGEVVVRMVATRLLQPLEADGQVAPSLDGATDEDGGGGGDNRLGASPLPWGGGDFELNVKRSDPEAPSFLKSEPFAPGAGSIGVVATERGEVVTGIGSLTPAPDRIVTPTESGPGARVAVPTAATRADVDFELADEGPVEVYLGPLVSRTAAALGPALATTADEPTTSTDRGRPGTGGLEAFGADMDLEMILAIRARSEGGDADPSADPDPALTTLRGPGGVPIVVAGLRSGDRDTDSDDLAASVVGSGDDDATMLAEALDAAPPPDGPGPEVARAGIATRAVGFLIGMGLASGPLYPDLVALARKKLRLKPRRAGKRRSRPA